MRKKSKTIFAFLLSNFMFFLRDKNFSETIAFWEKIWYNIFVVERYSKTTIKYAEISKRL